MKKFNFITILLILTVFLFSSCDNTGVLDSIWNDEKATNENVEIVVGRTDSDSDSIYYLSQANGLTKYTISRGQTEILNSDPEFKASAGAAFDESGNYIISYKNATKTFTVANLTGEIVYKTSNAVTDLGEFKQARGYLVYCENGVYKLTYNAESKAITASRVGAEVTGSFYSIDQNSGVYEIRNSGTTEYYTSPTGTGLISNYSKANFGEETDPGSFVTATPNHQYMFFNKASKLNIYYYEDGTYVKKGEGISNVSFYNSNDPKAILTKDNSIILIRGTYALLVGTDGTQKSVNSNISYDFIEGVFLNTDSDTYTLITHNKGIHTLTVDGSTMSFN